MLSSAWPAPLYTRSSFVSIALHRRYLRLAPVPKRLSLKWTRSTLVFQQDPRATGGSSQKSVVFGRIYENCRCSSGYSFILSEDGLDRAGHSFVGEIYHAVCLVCSGQNAPAQSCESSEQRLRVDEHAIHSTMKLCVKGAKKLLPGRDELPCLRCLPTHLPMLKSLAIDFLS